MKNFKCLNPNPGNELQSLARDFLKLLENYNTLKNKNATQENKNWTDEIKLNIEENKLGIKIKIKDNENKNFKDSEKILLLSAYDDLNYMKLQIKENN